MKDFTEHLDAHLRPLVGLFDEAHRSERALRVVDPPTHPPFQVLLGDPRPESVPATPDAAPRPPARAWMPTRRFRRGRSSVVAAAAGLVATAASVTFLAGTGAAQLPILETPSTDASAAASPTMRRAGVDLRRGHAFQTAAGPGFVVASPDGERLCLALPDTADEGRYGSTCAARTAVERDGLILEVVGDRTLDADARNVVAVLLPVGAAGVRLQTDEGTTTPAIQDGVFTAGLRDDAVLTYSSGGATHHTAFSGPFRDTTFSCRGEAVARTAGAAPADCPD